MVLTKNDLTLTLTATISDRTIFSHIEDERHRKELIFAANIEIKTHAAMCKQDQKAFFDSTVIYLQNNNKSCMKLTTSALSDVIRISNFCANIKCA